MPCSFFLLADLDIVNSLCLWSQHSLWSVQRQNSLRKLQALLFLQSQLHRVLLFPAPSMSTKQGMTPDELWRCERLCFPDLLLLEKEGGKNLLEIVKKGNGFLLKKELLAQLLTRIACPRKEIFRFSAYVNSCPFSLSEPWALVSE